MLSFFICLIDMLLFLYSMIEKDILYPIDMKTKMKTLMYQRKLIVIDNSMHIPNWLLIKFDNHYILINFPRKKSITFEMSISLDQISHWFSHCQIS